jgi:hypothetical protein
MGTKFLVDAYHEITQQILFGETEKGNICAYSLGACVCVHACVLGIQFTLLKLGF